LALCIVDSVQSTGVTYTSVVNGYRRYQRQQGGNPETDGAPELAATFDDLDGPDGWAREIGNQNKTSTRAGAPHVGRHVSPISPNVGNPARRYTLNVTPMSAMRHRPAMKPANDPGDRVRHGSKVCL
jgi:hypothetical protein